MKGLRILRTRRYSTLTMLQYHDLSDRTLENIVESLEGYEEQYDQQDYEVSYNQGVLKLALGEKGIYVLNKQAPNQQIWWSSPLSGPKRFSYEGEAGEQLVWKCVRTGVALDTLLTRELAELTGDTFEIHT